MKYEWWYETQSSDSASTKTKNGGWVEQKWSIIWKKTVLRREREKGQRERERNKQMIMRRRLNHVPAVLWCFYDLHPELIWLINIRFDPIDADLRDSSVYFQISFTAHWTLIKRRSRQSNGFIRMTDSSVCFYPEHPCVRVFRTKAD